MPDKYMTSDIHKSMTQVYCFENNRIEVDLF